MREADAQGPFYVVGGIYQNTKFQALAPGEELLVFGPYASHAKADDVWRDKSFALVDNALARFTVLSEHELDDDARALLDRRR